MPFLGSGLRGPKGDTGSTGASGTTTIEQVDALMSRSFYRDFATLKNLNDHGTGPSITFTRASGATYFDANGVLQTAANDAPRFDHDPVTGASRGLLIEEARTNHMLRSAEFSSWGKVRSSITADTIAGPDGTTTADTFIEDSTASNTHHVAQGVVGLSAAQALTGSVFAKAKERDRLRVQIWNNTTGVNGVRATFNLSDGTVSEVTNEGTGTGAAASIVYVGNGWYRCSVSGTPATSDDAALALLLNNGTSSSYTGDGTSGLYIWGAQLEVGAFPTSYIPTTTAAATRAVDVALVTPISSFFNHSESTVVAEASLSGIGPVDVSFPSIFHFNKNNNDGTNRLAAGYANILGVPKISAGYLSGGVSQIPYADATVSLGVANTIGVAVSASSARTAVNGNLLGSDSAITMNSENNTLKLGTAAFNGFALNGHIRKIAYWPKRLTNTLLQQLTA